MAEFKPTEYEVATMVREFNAGHSKHRTATELAKAIIETVRNNDQRDTANAKRT